MKRNWDTIRELLSKVEECTLPTEMVRLADFPEEKAAEIVTAWRVVKGNNIK